MARLSHPNVVTVHEVGSVHGEIFVVMEYVKGRDLRAWLEQAPHSPAEVLAVFLDATSVAAGIAVTGRNFDPRPASCGLRLTIGRRSRA